MAEIAAALDRHPGTIYRELGRNSNGDGSYRPVSAEGRYLARRQRQRVIDAHPALAAFIRERLLEGWTPEQVSGWLKAGNESLPWVCFETIYAWIFTGVALAEKLWKCLPGKKATRRRRRDLPRKIDIDAVSDEELQEILLTHNLTPRKCLGFKTPAQALLQELGIDVKISFSPILALRD